MTRPGEGRRAWGRGCNGKSEQVALGWGLEAWSAEVPALKLSFSPVFCAWFGASQT